MKKYVLLFLATVTLFSCSTNKKSAYKSVDQRDVPQRYMKDFQRMRPEVKEVNWQMADTNTYFANFKTEDNDCIMEFNRTSTATYYVIPKEYVPTDITDYVNQNYQGYTVENTYICDSQNKKYYITNIKKKSDNKKLQFDLQGNFDRVIETAPQK